MGVTDSFSANYAQARAKFHAAVAAAGGHLKSAPHPEPGPDGGALATDAAWLGPRDAETALVLLSGTHGVEGFCGSGAQIEWLARGGAADLPKGMAALVIHAVNPYGFAWLRRVTQENVDLNRNWIDFTAPPPQNAGYDELADAAVPTEWTEATQAAGLRAFGGYVGRHGAPALQQALSGGQYNHPRGVFYGGAAPTWSRKTQTALYETFLSGCRRVAIIDFHTGLGPYGFAEQIVTASAREPEYVRAAAWYGGAIASPNDGASVSAPIVGDGLSAAPGLLPNAEVTGMALEYGTQPMEKVVAALRADAWLHANGDLGSELGRSIKAQIRDAFYGDDDVWKGMVVGQALLACRQAMTGLRGD